MKRNFHGRSYLKPKMKQGLVGDEGEERDGAKALRQKHHVLEKEQGSWLEWPASLMLATPRSCAPYLSARIVGSRPIMTLGAKDKMNTGIWRIRNKQQRMSKAEGKYSASCTSNT